MDKDVAWVSLFLVAFVPLPLQYVDRKKSREKEERHVDWESSGTEVETQTLDNGDKSSQFAYTSKIPS